MPIPVRLQDGVDAIDAVGIELQAYLDKVTGDVVAVNEADQHVVEGEAEPDLEEYPDWHREALSKPSSSTESQSAFSLSLGPSSSMSGA